jgi:hypothetical protein
MALSRQPGAFALNRPGFESALERNFNNLQSTAGAEKHYKTSQASLTDRKWIAVPHLRSSRMRSSML